MLTLEDVKIRLDDAKAVLFGGWLDSVKLKCMLEDDDILLFTSRLDAVKLKPVVEDWILFIVNWLNNVELMLTLVVLVTVLFGVTLGSKVVEFWLADFKVTVFETMTKVDIFDNLEGGILDAEGVGVIAKIPCACLRTLRCTMSFWVPDKTCHPTTGTPISVLMVPSWAAVSSFEKPTSVSFNAPHAMFQVMKLLMPLANLPSPTPAAITVGLSSCCVIGLEISPEKKPNLLESTLRWPAILTTNIIRWCPLRLCMSMFNTTVPRIACILGGHHKPRAGLWSLLLKPVVLRWTDTGSCSLIDITTMENDCDPQTWPPSEVSFVKATTRML